MTPGANLAAVMLASCIFRVEIALSAIFAVVTAPVAKAGLGYVPERSPPAVPLGGKDPGITPAANFAAVTEPSAIFAVVTALVLIVGLGYVPVKSPPANPVGVVALGINPGANLAAVTAPSANS